MERFSIEISPRKVAAGRKAETPPAATPCDITGCVSRAEQGSGVRKADRDPEVRRPQDLSPLSDG